MFAEDPFPQTSHRKFVAFGEGHGLDEPVDTDTDGEGIGGIRTGGTTGGSISETGGWVGTPAADAQSQSASTASLARMAAMNSCLREFTRLAAASEGNNLRSFGSVSAASGVRSAEFKGAGIEEAVQSELIHAGRPLSLTVQLSFAFVFTFAFTADTAGEKGVMLLDVEHGPFDSSLMVLLRMVLSLMTVLRMVLLSIVLLWMVLLKRVLLTTELLQMRLLVTELLVTMLCVS